LQEPLKPTASIRSTPADFVVEEIPAYEPCGQGAHLFVLVRKTGLTTIECARRLAARFCVDPRDVGYAGMKDCHAVTTQSFSVPFAETTAIESLGVLGFDGVELLGACRHTNKLRTGHLVGNRFRIALRRIDPPEALPALCETLLLTQTRGLPNAYGPQRFGRNGDNPERALSWLRGQSRGPSNPREKRLLISSIQSMLFDEVLRRRVDDRTWDTVLAGDVAKRHDTGGLFECEDETVDRPRAARGEISPTGPIFGTRMRWPKGHAEQIERQVLADKLGDDTILQRFGKNGEGSRRALRLMPSLVRATRLDDDPSGLLVEFELTKGAYATTFLGAACGLVDESRRDNNRDVETSRNDELLQHTEFDSE
jgi:tRNA pseudouridine13 synthase